MLRVTKPVFSCSGGLENFTFHSVYQIEDYVKLYVVIAGSFKSQLIDYFERHIVLWEHAFSSFMVIRPSLSCIHWLEFVYRMNAVT